MRAVAERAAHEYGVEFLYRDFRPYFAQGQERARQMEMYIQKFCGCVFSEQERYLKPKKIIP
jgi:predicted adenine nucleotide alpha hydrolase (AANH) superfamily ATPase